MAVFVALSQDQRIRTSVRPHKHRARPLISAVWRFAGLGYAMTPRRGANALSGACVTCGAVSGAGRRATRLPVSNKCSDQAVFCSVRACLCPNRPPTEFLLF
jgi:hypothetical protein